jgi:hypothetical protein
LVAFSYGLVSSTSLGKATREQGAARGGARPTTRPSICPRTTSTAHRTRRSSSNANSQFTGLIYAPRARIAIQTVFEIYGSVMARRVALGSNSAIHYDTSLLFDDDNGPPVFEQVSWRPIGME